MSTPDRRDLLDRVHPKLSVRRQCSLLGLARSGVYRVPSPATAVHDDLSLMRQIDEMYTSWPFFGSRRSMNTLSIHRPRPSIEMLSAAV
jgi:putative transposase